MSLRRTFDGLLPELRRALSLYVREARRKDRGLASVKGWNSQSRGPEEYFFCLGIMPSYLEAWISDRIKRGKLEFLEAGMGRGVFCRALLDRYRDSLNAVGLRLTYSAQLKSLNSLRQKVGLLESLSLEKRFDLVISARGAFVYSLNSFAALETTLNGLKLGAIAYFDDNKLLMPKAWFRDYLGQQGVEVEVTRYERGVPYAYKLKRNSARGLDLSKFTKRYIEGLNAWSAEILEYGFDRTPKNSPMTALLSSLYEEALYRDLLPGGRKGPLNPSSVAKESLGDRLLEISDMGGVTFVNDAFSQTLNELHGALERWRDRRILWIAGGMDALALEKLAKKNTSIRGAIFFGEGRRALAETFQHLELRFTGQELKDALEKAYHIAKPGDLVLFSPGLMPDAMVHGNCEYRAADFRRCLKELREMAAWGHG